MTDNPYQSPLSEDKPADVLLNERRGKGPRALTAAGTRLGILIGGSFGAGGAILTGFVVVMVYGAEDPLMYLLADGIFGGLYGAFGGSVWGTGAGIKAGMSGDALRRYYVVGVAAGAAIYGALFGLMQGNVTASSLGQSIYRRVGWYAILYTICIGMGTFAGGMGGWLLGAILAKRSWGPAQPRDYYL
ncbi:MAG: hypothetical protein K8T25_02235 [Planctomycetia bacterium]|nr:hypothetical protein [Planctomycetia bacterium]